MPHPVRHPSTLCALRAQAISLLKAKSGREGRGWCQLRQLEEELDPASRSTNQVAEVFHLVGARIAGGGCSVPGGRTLLPAPCRPLLERRLAASCDVSGW